MQVNRQTQVKNKMNKETGVKKDLDFIVVNHLNYKRHYDDISAAQEFLSGRYAADKVISCESAIALLAGKENEAYNWVIKKHKDKIVAVVVSDVWDVPKSASKKELVSDGKNQYTALFYATAAGKKYEPVLTDMIKTFAIELAKIYSLTQGKRNVGILTDDTRHRSVLMKLIKDNKGYGGSLGEIGAPTMKDFPEERYEELNFKTNNYAELVLVPFKKVTKLLAERIVASYLDQGYNSKGPGEKGYTPLTNMESFKRFVKNLNLRNPGRFVDFGMLADNCLCRSVNRIVELPEIFNPACNR